MGHGAPVDQIDHACLSYKHCLACIRNQLNDDACVPELVGYTLEGPNILGGDLHCRKYKHFFEDYF